MNILLTSGLATPIAEMPMPALPVPYAEPTHANTKAMVAPPKPRAGAQVGQPLRAAAMSPMSYEEENQKKKITNSVGVDEPSCKWGMGPGTARLAAAGGGMNEPVALLAPRSLVLAG